jgi:hypothetical protein
MVMSCRGARTPSQRTAHIVPIGLGFRLAEFVVERFRLRGDGVELIDAKAVGLPLFNRMHKE